MEPGTRLVARTTWGLPPEHPQNETMRTFLEAAAAGWVSAMAGLLAGRADHGAGPGTGSDPAV